mmetsp:Transcript_14082/g.13909  ORF Transcript_14082/g.13909 Transcript_14082/m.13909 type:complete len:86 (+) Transcript_14082:1210-1467(+)
MNYQPWDRSKIAQILIIDAFSIGKVIKQHMSITNMKNTKPLTEQQKEMLLSINFKEWYEANHPQNVAIRHRHRLHEQRVRKRKDE